MSGWITFSRGGHTAKHKKAIQPQHDDSTAAVLEQLAKLAAAQSGHQQATFYVRSVNTKEVINSRTGKKRTVIHQKETEYGVSLAGSDRNGTVTSKSVPGPKKSESRLVQLYRLLKRGIHAVIFSTLSVAFFKKMTEEAATSAYPPLVGKITLLWTFVRRLFA